MGDKVLIITEIDLDTGEYEVTFRNKSHPGRAMDYQRIRDAFWKVAESFFGSEAKTGPKQVLS